MPPSLGDSAMIEPVNPRRTCDINAPVRGSKSS